MAERDSAAMAGAAQTPAEVVLVITRILDAPRSLVWKAWTEPDRMVHWLGPQGFTGKVVKMETRPGGAYRFHLRGPDGSDHWAQGTNREVVEQERLVYTWAWADANGNATGPETHITVTFESVGTKTRLTLRQSGFESVNARDLHRGGWNGSFDRLAEYLASVQ